MEQKESLTSKKKSESDAIPKKWYEILQNETFHTEFLPISQPVAQAFVNF